MVNIKLRTSKTSFNLSFSGKYNIIIGNSGTKKSFFVNIAASSYKPNKLFHMDTSIDDKFVDKSCVHIITNHHNNNDLSIMKRYKGHIFIIDEFSDIFSNKDFPSIVQDSENYFIFISRKIYGWLPVSIDSIYQFRVIGKNVTNVPVYCQDNSDLIDIHF